MIEAPTPRTIPPIVSVIALCAGGLTAALTQTMVIPIQPELPTLLGTDRSNAAWVVTITLLAAAVSMVVAGRLADLYGKQRILAISAAVLVGGSVVCALSDSLAPMLVGRALQGMAMGFIPIGISLIREITPPAMASSSIAAMSATLGVGGAIGLPLSAWIAESGDWHVLFWVSAGVAAIGLALGGLAGPHRHRANPGSFGLPRAGGPAGGLVAFLVGVSKGNDWGWADAGTLGFIAGGIVVLVGWAFFELRRSQPLVDLRATARPAVLLTNLAAVAIGFGMMAQSIAIPQLLQMPEATGYGLGRTMLEAGLWMAPGGLVMMLLSPVSGRLIGRAGARVTLIAGAVVLAGGYAVGAVLNDAAWQLMVVSCIAAAGVGIGYAAMPTLILDNTPRHEAAAAVGLNALSRSVGTTLAAAVMGTILASRTATLETPAGAFELPTHGAFVLCFVVGAAAALGGALIIAASPRRREAQEPSSAPALASAE